MASIIPIGDKWRAQVRRKGYPIQTKTFGTKILADKWARRLESDIDAGRAGVLPKGALPIGKLIQRYREEMQGTKDFGRNKDDVLKRLEHFLDLDDAYTISAERIILYIRKERGISGVTAGIDLTYLKGVFKMARALWRLQVRPGVVDEAREMLRYMGLMERGQERDRRPTENELVLIKGWLAEHSIVLTPDHIDFILDSAFRPPSEIERLRWDDLNRKDRTILIRDRKDPKKKIGNNQVVPLLGRCMEIIGRQKEAGEFIFPVNGSTWSTIFPRACAALEIEDLRLYDLRHEAISRLVESGKYSIPEVMLVSGHKDPKQMMRYTQLRAKNLHR
jgi:integrase